MTKLSSLDIQFLSTIFALFRIWKNVSRGNKVLLNIYL